VTDPGTTEYSAPPPESEKAPMAKLTLRLIGRVCIVNHGGKYTALFLDALRNPRIGLRRHTPVFCGPLDRVVPSLVRKKDVSFGDPSGAAHGLWSINGYDLKFVDLVPPDQICTALDQVPNLNRIYAKIDPNAQWRGAEDLILTANPRPFGVAARLSLEGFHTIRAAAPPKAKAVDRRYHPGEFRQSVHGMVECIGYFLKEEAGPVLSGESFDGCIRPSFEIGQEDDIALSMSNVCACLGVPDRRPHPDDPDWELDDDEFVLMYELLVKPPDSGRPLPYRERTGGGGGVPECYIPGSLTI
jgi:hypothetical protein